MEATLETSLKELDYLENDRYHVKKYLTSKCPWTFWIPLSGIFLQWRYLQYTLVANLIDRNLAWKTLSLFQLIFVIPIFFTALASLSIMIGVIVNDTNGTLLSLYGPQGFLFYWLMVIPFVIYLLIQPWMHLFFKKRLMLKYQITNLEAVSRPSDYYFATEIKDTKEWIKNLYENRKVKQNKWFFSSNWKPSQKLLIRNYEISREAKFDAYQTQRDETVTGLVYFFISWPAFLAWYLNKYMNSWVTLNLLWRHFKTRQQKNYLQVVRKWLLVEMAFNLFYLGIIITMLLCAAYLDLPVLTAFIINLSVFGVAALYFAIAIPKGILIKNFCLKNLLKTTSK